jgi:hypothetical protein
MVQPAPLLLPDPSVAASASAPTFPEDDAEKQACTEPLVSTSTHNVIVTLGRVVMSLADLASPRSHSVEVVQT